MQHRISQFRTMLQLCLHMLQLESILTCYSDGSTMGARAILDSGSSASFILERLAQSLRLHRSKQNMRILGVTDFVRDSNLPVTSFHAFSVHSPTKKISTSAVIVPRDTCDLPLHPVQFDQSWKGLLRTISRITTLVWMMEIHGAVTQSYLVGFLQQF